MAKSGEEIKATSTNKYNKTGKNKSWAPQTGENKLEIFRDFFFFSYGDVKLLCTLIIFFVLISINELFIVKEQNAYQVRLTNVIHPMCCHFYG